MMKRMLSWFLFGVFLTFGMMLIVFGVFFMRNLLFAVGTGSGEFAVPSLLFGIVLILVGGGLISSTVAETVRRTLHK
jgi:hypothetical protein